MAEALRSDLVEPELGFTDCMGQMWKRTHGRLTKAKVREIQNLQEGPADLRWTARLRLSELCRSVSAVLISRLRAVAPWIGGRRNAVAAEVVLMSWPMVRRPRSTRNAFHPEVLDDIDSYFSALTALPTGRIRGAGAGLELSWEALDRARRRIDCEFVRQVVAAEVERRAAIAADGEFLTRWNRQVLWKRDQEGWTVQHHASGLRALFYWPAEADPANRIGVVYSKPYKIESIDRGRNWPEEGHQAYTEYSGLGIGRRLYLHGAQLEPSIRWGITILSEHSTPVRAWLHRADPWRWQPPDGVCGWCDQHGWKTLTAGLLTEHDLNA